MRVVHIHANLVLPLIIWAQCCCFYLFLEPLLWRMVVWKYLDESEVGVNYLVLRCVIVLQTRGPLGTFIVSHESLKVFLCMYDNIYWCSFLYNFVFKSCGHVVCDGGGLFLFDFFGLFFGLIKLFEIFNFLLLNFRFTLILMIHGLIVAYLVHPCEMSFIIFDGGVFYNMSLIWYLDY